MEASALDAFYYCMGTSSERASNGYWTIRFADVGPTNGLLDPDVLTTMATVS